MSLPTHESPDPLAVYSIGLKLRTLRSAKNLTLSRVATQSRLSTALLSKIENDRMIPTLHTLEKLCRVYGINLGHFFCEPQHHSVSITRKGYSAPRRGDSAVRRTPLHISTAETHQLSQIIDIPAAVSSTIGEYGVVSEVTAYVIGGVLHVDVSGTREVLESGDSVVVTTDQPMVWSAEKSACKVLAVFARSSSGHPLA